FIVFGFAIDVPFPVMPGFRLDPASIQGNEITLGGLGLGTVQIDTSVAPRVLGDGTTVRFRIKGAFAAQGAVTATFTRGSWSVIDPIGANGTINLGDLSGTNGRTYLDVRYTPSSGETLDLTTITDLADEFALTGAGSGVTLTGDVTQLGDGSFRYYATGTFATGQVSVAFVGLDG